MFKVRQIERFKSRYKVLENGCWEWTHSKSYKGYGKFWYPGGASAHKFSYLLHVGPVSEGLVLDHACRKRDCVNPNHLRAVTPQFNTLVGDGPAAKHAKKSHCVHGHPLSGNNLKIIRIGKRSSRKCLTCQLAAKRAYNAANADKVREDNKRRWREKYRKSTGPVRKWEGDYRRPKLTETITPKGKD